MRMVAHHGSSFNICPCHAHQPKDEQSAVVIPSDIANTDRRAIELVLIAFNLWELGIPVFP